MTTASRQPTLYWTPSPEHIASSQHDAFRRHVNDRFGKTLAATDYAALHRWSVDPSSNNDFWTSIWDWSGIVGERDPQGVSDETRSTRSQPAHRPRRTRFFVPGGT